MLELILKCIEHPEIVFTGMIIGWLAPSNINQLTAALVSLLSPLLGIVGAALSKILSFVKSKISKKSKGE